jgi:hypothetical protein
MIAPVDRMTDGILSIWTIYDHPRDYPTGFIARRHEVVVGGTGPTDDTVKADDLYTLRKHLLQAGLTRINRSPDDEPQIVESWI